MKTTKQLVTNFYFPRPNWSDLPDEFPNLSKKGLTKQEGYLLDGIKLVWTISEGRETFYITTAKRIFIGFAFIILVFLSSNLLVKSEKSITKSVSAKTVSQSVEEFVEATMSAVFK